MTSDQGSLDNSIEGEPAPEAVPQRKDWTRFPREIWVDEYDDEIDYLSVSPFPIHSETGANEVRYVRADTVGDPHDRRGKDDAGKPRAAMVLGGFARALAAVAEVGTLGADKYPDDGWRSTPDGEARYGDAMMRHWLALHAGADHDAESRCLHAAHIAWNALAVLERRLMDVESARASDARRP